MWPVRGIVLAGLFPLSSNLLCWHFRPVLPRRGKIKEEQPKTFGDIGKIIEDLKFTTDGPR
jgi:hypothetical protein